MAELLLVEVEQVKNAMDMPESVTDKDVIIKSLILGVSRDFEEISSRSVDILERSEVLDVEAFTNDIKLKAWPVQVDDPTPIFEIFHDPDRAFGAATEVDSSSYYLDTETGKVDLFIRFPVAKKTLKVTYTGGMAAMDSPGAGEEFWNLYPDIAEAVTFEVIENFKSIPNLGSAVVRIGGDWTQMFALKDRTPKFKRMATLAGRIFI